MKEKFYAGKQSVNIWDANNDNIVISKLILKNLKTYKSKSGDKNENNNLMYFHIDNVKQLGKYKTIWTKIEDLENIELNFLPFFHEIYKNQIKKIR